MICCFNNSFFSEIIPTIWNFISSDFFLGLLSGYVVTWFFFYYQFKKSSAGHRLRKVIDATKEFCQKTQNTSMLRDRYRYSLGVQIDAMLSTFGTDSSKDTSQNFPKFCEIKKLSKPKEDGNPYADRWHQFDLYVRPVINDINPYSFLGWIPSFPFLFSDINSLKKLSALCFAIENVVSELDACKEYEIHHSIPDSTILSDQNPPGITINFNQETEKHKPTYDRLFNSYKELRKIWFLWLHSIKK